jgi:hypothetical protein
MYTNIYEIKRIHIDIKIIGSYQNEELPLHLIQELTRT